MYIHGTMTTTATITTVTVTTATSSHPIPLLPPVLPANTTYAAARMSQRMGQDMTFLHNLIIRGFNSILIQAPYIKPGTPAASDILTFTTLVTGFLHHHHDTEEGFFFPEVEKAIGEKGFMDQNISQHDAFEGKLDMLTKYAEQTTSADYSPTKLVALIEDMTPPLIEHLGAEITTLTSLDGRASEKELARIWQGAEEYARAQNQDLTKFVPLMLGLRDETYPREGDRSVGLPWFFQYLAQYKLADRYKGAWRFLPSTYWGKPRPYAFVPKELGGLGETE